MTITLLQNPQVIAHYSIYNQSKTLINSNENISNLCNLIRNRISQGSPKEALLLYAQARRKGLLSVAVVVPLVFKACAFLSFLSFGKAIHAESITAGVAGEVMVGTSLVSMYAKCGNVIDSRKVFDFLPERNVVTWNAMIGGYLTNKDTTSASILFEKMPIRNGVTWIEMIDGFGKCGDTITARQLFNRVPPELRNVVTWTVMVDAYTANGQMEAAREFFEEMPQRNFFAWSSMISGYCKRGDVKEAKGIFDRIPVRNLVNWNSLISGYAQNGFCEEALEAFRETLAEGFEPDEVSIASALSACAQLGLLDAGKEIHCRIHRKGIRFNVFVLNGLVDMYAKCGNLAIARLVFERIAEKSTICWNAMISGCATHGQPRDALELFGRMENSNKTPDDITFLSVMSACAHGGLVDEGLEIFSKMEKYGLQASIRHYGCLVDLLGRVGRLKEARDLIRNMPVKPNNTVWTALLGACRVHLDLDVAEELLKYSTTNLNTVTDNDSVYVLLSQIYAASESWEKAERIRKFMVDQGLQKIPGCSSVL